MALVIADRVRETTSSVGTGTIALTGAFLGFQPFSTIGNGNSTYYAIINAATGDWEVGVGTYTTAGNTLSRTTVLSSSNAGALVSFSAGLKDVICTQPASRSVLLDATLSGGTANSIPYLNGSKVLTTGTALTFDGTLLTNTAGGITAAGLTSNATGGEGGQLTLSNPTNTGAVATFDVLDATTARLFTTVNNAALIIGQLSGTGGLVTFNTAATEKMRIDSAGNVGIGTTNIGGFGGTVNLGGSGNPASGYLEGYINTQTVPTSVTVRFDAFLSAPNTAASTFNLTAFSHFNAQQGTFGAGSTVSTQAGFRASSNLISAANNMGFLGDIPAGTNRWNFYAGGTANNYFAGNVGIGVAAPTVQLQVSGTTRLGTTSIESAGAIEVNQHGTGDRPSYIDFHSSGLPGALDYSARILRNSGVNGNFEINNTGTGQLNFFQAGVAPINFFINGSERMRLDSTGLGVGTNAPDELLTVRSTTTNAVSSAQVYADSAAISPFFTLRRRNTANTATPNNVRVGELRWDGLTSTNAYAHFGGIGLDNGVNTATGAPSSMIFSTSAGAGAVERMRIDSAGNLGIGTSSPGKKLDLVGQFRVSNSAASGYALIEYGTSATATNNWHSGSEGDGTFRWYNGTSGAGIERMRIDSAGNVGVGTATASSFGRMAIVGGSAGTATSSLSINTASTAQGLRADLAFYSTFVGTADNDARRTADIIAGYSSSAWGTEYLSFNVGNNGGANDTKVVTAEKMRINSAGNVGVGTSSPTYKMDVATAALGTTLNSQQYAYRDTTSTGNVDQLDILYNRTTAGTDWTTADLIIRRNVDNSVGQSQIRFTGDNGGATTFWTGTAERMRILSGGNVGIGTSAPAYRFDVRRSDSSALAQFYQGGAALNTDIVVNNVGSANNFLISRRSNGESWLYNSGADPFVFYTNAAERMRITSTGNVGINTSTPATALDVNGTITADMIVTDSSLGFRNRIINGDMRIDQRNAGTALSATPFTSVYSVDRWQVYSVGSTQTVQRVAGTGSFQNALQVTGATGNTTTNIFQRIESANSFDLAGQAVTVSAQITVPSARTLTWIIYRANSTDNFSGVTQEATGTVALASGVNTIKFPATLSANATTGLLLDFNFGAFTTGSLQITGVQLEAGTAATPFERRSYTNELQLCQRYYEKSYDQSVRPGTASATSLWVASGSASSQYLRVSGSFRTDKRASPTMTLYNPTTGATGTVSVDGTAVSGTIGGSQTAFSFYTNNVTTTVNQFMAGHWVASAELQ